MNPDIVQLTVYAPFEILWLPTLWIITWLTSAEQFSRTVNGNLHDQAVATNSKNKGLLTYMYLAMCISHPNCCSPPLLSCLYGLGSIPTIGTCAQRAPGPTAAQCYTSIVVLQSCISLFKPTCIRNISQSGVVVRFRPRTFMILPSYLFHTCNFLCNIDVVQINWINWNDSRL